MSADSSPFDPLGVWKRFYQVNEEAAAASLHRFLDSSEFASLFSRWAESNAAFMELLHKTTEAYLRAVQFPSRSDLARLGTMVAGVEGKVDGLDDRLEALEDALGALREQVASLANRFQNLTEAMERMATTGAAVPPAASGSPASDPDGRAAPGPEAAEPADRSAGGEAGVPGSGKPRTGRLRKGGAPDGGEAR